MLSSFFRSRFLGKLKPSVLSTGDQKTLYRMRNGDPLVWIDCEMTGLDPDKESIMSICCFVTDAQLTMKDEQGWEAIIQHSKERLDQMDEWCTNTHGNSGLTQACIASTTTHEEAAEGLLSYIKQHATHPRRSLLAGNSVHHDKIFLSKGPYRAVTDYLGYRILDVSSIKEAVKRWSPDDVVMGIPPKQTLHQAREDILESIEEASVSLPFDWTPSNGELIKSYSDKNGFWRLAADDDN